MDARSTKPKQRLPRERTAQLLLSAEQPRALTQLLCSTVFGAGGGGGETIRALLLAAALGAKFKRLWRTFALSCSAR